MVFGTILQKTVRHLWSSCRKINLLNICLTPLSKMIVNSTIGHKQWITCSKPCISKVKLSIGNSQIHETRVWKQGTICSWSFPSHSPGRESANQKNNMPGSSVRPPFWFWQPSHSAADGQQLMWVPSIPPSAFWKKGKNLGLLRIEEGVISLAFGRWTYFV